MAVRYSKDFNIKLAELNNWQIEQQKKLKDFQETQRRLLDVEDSLNMNKSELNKDYIEQNAQENIIERSGSEIFEPEAVPINLEDQQKVNCDKYNIDISGNQNNRVQFKKTFLKRGDGLARFRMTLEDFKTTPKIYKEKNIKTHVNKKFDNISKTLNSKNGKTMTSTTHKKKAPIPVNIYLPEQKKKLKLDSLGKKLNPTDLVFKKKCTLKVADEMKETSSLKSYCLLTERNEKAKKSGKNSNISGFTKVDCDILDALENEVDIEKKKDEKELKIFEILEQKVKESSFCSTSSTLDRLMDLSVTPMNISQVGENLDKRYSNSLRVLHSQFLPEDHLIKFGHLFDHHKVSDDLQVDETNRKSSSKCQMIGDSYQRNADVVCETKLGDADQDVIELPVCSAINKSDLELQNDKSNYTEKTVDFLKDSTLGFKENDHQDRLFKKTEKAPTNQQKIALKLQRKSLQDNVKHLMNWENASSRKKLVKRVPKRSKPRALKIDKPKFASVEESEKIILNSGLLKEKLSELEKEIQVFRKENSRVEKLQKQCVEEQMKLAKEKKEFEKFMDEEKQKIEARISEGQKKLQKERNVFETYCKQVKNRPGKQEREEVTQLKAELGKLKETMATKDARWGAAQARLRNQIKTLEKENLQLKCENEKLSKIATKRVSFRNGKNINAKIIHAINSELGKLKPVIVNPEPSCICGIDKPSSARAADFKGENSLRRINSVPNIKRTISSNGCPDRSNDDRVEGSISMDSGIETSEFKLPKDLQIAVEADEGLTSLTGVVQEAIFDGTEPDRSNFDCSQVTDAFESFNISQRRENGNCSMETVPLNDQGSEPDGSARVNFQWKSATGDTNGEKVSACCFGNHFDSNEERRPEIRQRMLEDGTKEISYPNGNVKKIFPGNDIIHIIYYNGDIKETNKEDGYEKYYYSESKTWHTTYSDGMEVLEFPNGQTERRYADGSTEISFPNGCVRYCDALGVDEWRFPDGTVIKTNVSGHKIMLMPNGQKEVHTDEFKRREYPDGTVKIVYSNGTQETRYASGRVRLKDKKGNLIMDTGGIS